MKISEIFISNVNSTFSTSLDEADDEFDVKKDQALKAKNKVKQDYDFKLMMSGAMSRDAYNKKWKLGLYRPK